MVLQVGVGGHTIRTVTRIPTVSELTNAFGRGFIPQITADASGVRFRMTVGKLTLVAVSKR
jgi:hypothetical protein